MKESIIRNPDLVLRYRHWLFLAMLALLHFTLMRGTEDTWARALFVAHAGFFILWQPFFSVQRRLSAIQVLGIGVVSVVCAVWLAWWLLGIWLAVLAGIIGGKVFYAQAHWLRRFYLGALLYLIAMQLMFVVPAMIGQMPRFGGVVYGLCGYGLPLILLTIGFFPTERNATESAEVIDFIYSLLVFLLLAILALGSIAFMTLGSLSYIAALLHTLMSIAAVLLLLGLGWNPRASFGGIGMMFSRYLMTIGMPLEQWLHDLAELSQRENDPERFAQKAFSDMAQLPWLYGGEWKAAQWSGVFGERPVNTTTKGVASNVENCAEFSAGPILATIYSRGKLSPAMIWHCRLLIQIVGEFFTAKLQAQELKERSYMQAIHETGARLTHDVKNILQALNLLIAAAEKRGTDSELERAQVQALIRRQLPVISQRLAQTVSKLKQPQTDSGKLVPAADWWSSIQKQYQDSEISFVTTGIGHNVLLPGSLFDSIADNLIHNALDKRTLEKTLRIEVALVCNPDVELCVADNGSAIPAHTADRLFSGPVQSENGLGIGLYQASRQAAQAGYSLKIVENEAGNVCFSLSAV